MIDLANERDIGRLFSAIRASDDAIRPFRVNRRKAIEDYVGSRYTPNGARFVTMVNLINQAADAYTVALAANCPRVRVTTPFKELRPFATKYQVALNNFLKEMHVEETFGQLVLDAFFCVGVAKVYQKDFAYVELEGDVWCDPGRPYVARVSIDDFVMDMSVSQVRQARFMGDYYRVSWERVRTEPNYDPAVIARLAPTSKYGSGTTEKAQEISSGSVTDGDEYEPMIDLMDVWLPELNVVATFGRDVQSPPLCVRDCGNEGGPYHLLSFADVPDNPMPSAPAHNLKDLHDLYNGLFRKMTRQAQRHKVNPIYRPGAQDDAARLKRVNDGEWVQVQDPTSISTIVQGGIEPSNVAFNVAVMQLFDRMAGNLQAMIGLGPQAETLGQEQMIYGAVSKREAKLIARVNSLAAEVVTHVGQLMWLDAAMAIPGELQLTPRLSVDASWTPDDREGDFWQYNFQVEPYSMAYIPPAVKLQKLEKAIGQLIQLLPMLQAAGGNIDVVELVRLYGDMLDLPELSSVITFMEPVAPPPGMGSDSPSPGKPNNTSREYIRRNVSMGGTPQARSDALQEALLKAGGKQGAMQGRPQQAAAQ